MTAQLKLAKELLDRKEELASIKAMLADAQAKYDEVEVKMIQSIQEDGMPVVIDGRVLALNETESISAPKTIEEKRLLAQYIESNHGPDVKDKIFSPNFQSLNGFWRSLESKKSLPGCGEPTTKITLSNKAYKK